MLAQRSIYFHTTLFLVFSFLHNRTELTLDNIARKKQFLVPA